MGEPQFRKKVASSFSDAEMPPAEKQEATEGKRVDPCCSLSRFITVVVTMYRLARSHLGLIILLVVYSFMGAGIFTHVEGGATQPPVNITWQREHLAESLLQVLRYKNYTSYTGNITLLIRDDDVDTATEVEHILSDYEALVTKADNCGKAQTDTWDFWGSLFFCATVYTTIGYGHIAPLTKLGRFITILYALVGIPLFLLVMADVGKLMTKFIKFVIVMLRRARKKLLKKWRRWKLKKQSTPQSPSNRHLQAAESGSSGSESPVTPGNVSLRSVTNGSVSYNHSSVIVAHGNMPGKHGNVPVINGDVSGDESSTSSKMSSGTSSKMSLEQQLREEVDDEFDLPPYIAIGIALIYILLGAGMYMLWEPWTYTEAIYFLFISISTIGFGDILPEHPKYFMISSIYIIIGLALVAMVINVMVTFTSKTVAKAKTKVAEAGKTFKEGVSTMTFTAKNPGLSELVVGKGVGSRLKNKSLRNALKNEDNSTGHGLSGLVIGKSLVAESESKPNKKQDMSQLMVKALE